MARASLSACNLTCPAHWPGSQPTFAATWMGGVQSAKTAIRSIWHHNYMQNDISVSFLEQEWKACCDGLLLARIAASVGSLHTCQAIGAAAVRWALRYMSKFHDTIVCAAAAVEAWMSGQGSLASVEQAELALCSLINSGMLDYATRQAVYEVDNALSTVLACAAGRESACATLVAICESVIQAAGLVEWDEVHADAALCSAAPWPNAEYDQMVERRAAAEAAAHRALSDIVRAHVPYSPVDERFRV